MVLVYFAYLAPSMCVFFNIFFVVFLSLLCVAQAQQQQRKHLCRFLVVSVSVSVSVFCSSCCCCFYCFNLLRSAICLPRLFVVVVVRATEEQQKQQHLNLICSTLKFINSHCILFFYFRILYTKFTLNSGIYCTHTQCLYYINFFYNFFGLHTS